MRAVLGRVHLGERLRRAARRRHAPDAALEIRRVDDRAVRPPRAAAGRRRVGQDLRRSSGRLDRPKLAAGEESDRPAVGGPERKRRSLGPRDRRDVARAQRAHPQLPPAPNATLAPLGDTTGGAASSPVSCQDVRRGSRRRRRAARGERAGAASGAPPAAAAGPTDRSRRRHSGRRSGDAGAEPRRSSAARASGRPPTASARPDPWPGTSARRGRAPPERTGAAARSDADRRAGSPRSATPGSCPRRPSGRRHLVDDAAEREDVGARVGLLALELFRRHVLERAQDRSRLGQVLLLPMTVGSDVASGAEPAAAIPSRARSRAASRRTS